MNENRKSEKWGGKRAGAGRKLGTVQRRPYTKRLTDEEAEYLRVCLKQYRMLHPDPSKDEEGRNEASN